MNYELLTINQKQKCMDRHSSKFGYTLIELLVVIGILALAIGAIAMFLTSVLKGTNRTNIEAEVKQNGQSVLDSLERQIRGAVSAEKIGINDDYIKINRDFADPLHIRCDSQSGTHNSRIVLAVSVQPQLIDTDSQWKSVSNDDLKSGISIKDCNLDVFQSASSDSGTPNPAVVTVSFAATKSGPRLDLTASSRFETTISLRRY